MRVVIQLNAREELKALPILLRHSSGTILPNRTYVITKAAAIALSKAGVRFRKLSDEGDAPAVHGAKPGERV
jgi:hypothetical protein